MTNEEFAARKSKPTLFKYVKVGTKYRIFAEPTRQLRRSNDQTIYTKTCEAFSTSEDGKKEIILYPNDIVMRV